MPEKVVKTAYFGLKTAFTGGMKKRLSPPICLHSFLANLSVCEASKSFAFQGALGVIVRSSQP
ncbi:MAG: hypothetical protein NTW59_01750 [Candidatus Diapherotrites archaeon]|nr:hypothetical protein [Candidatus Diapherotrites archaeon]